MSAPLKVLYLLHDSRRSGVPAVMAGLIRSLDRTRVVPSVLFAHDGIYADELEREGVRVMTLGKRTPFLWRMKRFLLNVRLLTLAKEVDVIHVSSIKLALSVIVARLLGARVVFHLHEKIGRIGGILVKAMQCADVVLFCARNCADHYANVPAVRRRIIPNAIPVPEDPPRCPGSGVMNVVMFGSINSNKGQELLLRAFARLDHPRAKLYFYGTVGLSAHGYVRGLRAFVQEHDLSDRVFFPGPTLDAASVLKGASLMVHASLNECMSISVLEAMSRGVPVIANRITGMDEIITEGENGFLVPPGDVEALAERMGQLLDDQNLRRAIGEAGRMTVRERFNITRRARDFISLYEELAQ